MWKVVWLWGQGQDGFDILFEVEKILKVSLDSIPSPSPAVKIQIMIGKVCLRCQGKTLLGVVTKLLKTKSLLTSPRNVLPYNFKFFPANNLNFIFLSVVFIPLSTVYQAFVRYMVRSKKNLKKMRHRAGHGVYLEYWNTAKSLCSIWQHFSCLLSPI